MGEMDAIGEGCGYLTSEQIPFEADDLEAPQKAKLRGDAAREAVAREVECVEEGEVGQVGADHTRQVG
jgi:hypothetical protein